MGMASSGMTLTMTLPDCLAASLVRVQPALSKILHEGFAVEAYRQGILSSAEVGLLLGHDSRWETEDFLSAHDAWPAPTMEEVAAGAEALKSLRGK
jgi:hypothetical protein